MRATFETPELRVSEVSSEMSQPVQTRVMTHAVDILTPAAVKNLPPYFGNVDSITQARVWYERMVSESRLFIIEHKSSDLIIGFLFAHTGDDNEGHIGYVLGESHWGRGLASQLLAGFLDLSISEGKWTKLIGGVDKENAASSHLLEKMGFVKQPGSDGPVDFYEYPLW